MSTYKVRIKDGDDITYFDFDIIAEAHYFMVLQAQSISERQYKGSFDFCDNINEMEVYNYDGYSNVTVATLSLIKDVVAQAWIKYEKAATLWLNRTHNLSKWTPSSLPGNLQSHLESTVQIQQLYNVYIQLKNKGT